MLEGIKPRQEVIFKPWRMGKPLPSAAMQCCLNIYAKLRAESPMIPINDTVTRVCELSGITRTSLYRIRKQALGLQKLKTPGKARPGRVGKYTRAKIFSSFTLAAVRRKVHDFFRQNQPPTLQKVLADINKDDSLPNFKRTSLYRLLIDIGFEFVKRKNKCMLIDRGDLILSRRRYLREIRQFRKEGKKIYYMGDTWMNQVYQKTLEATCDDPANPNCKNALGLAHTPAGKGNGFILLHAGNEAGFVDGSFDLFRSKKHLVNNHCEMDAYYFEKWFTTKLLPNLDPNSVVVLDDAPHHSVQEEVLPQQNWRKAEIQRWLKDKGISYPPDAIKAELLVLAKSFDNPQVKVYKIDQLAKIAGHVVLRLPPFHCELNPIELIWTHVKGMMADKNLSKMNDVEQLTRTYVAGVTTDYWANCCRHAVEQEQKMWEVDSKADDVVEKFILSADNDSSSSDCGDEDDQNMDDSSSESYAGSQAGEPTGSDMSGLLQIIWSEGD